MSTFYGSLINMSPALEAAMPKVPPVPPQNRSSKGPDWPSDKSGKGSADDQPANTSREEEAEEDNIKQNTTPQQKNW